jgi:hypothetical protein
LLWARMQPRTLGLLMVAAGYRSAEVLASVVVISTRLASILEMRRYAPDGREHGPDAYVFADECGGKVKGFKTAWKLTCKRAGITACGSTICDARAAVGYWRRPASVSPTCGTFSGIATSAKPTRTWPRRRSGCERRSRNGTRLAQTSHSRHRRAKTPPGVPTVTLD